MPLGTRVIRQGEMLVPWHEGFHMEVNELAPKKPRDRKLFADGKVTPCDECTHRKGQINVSVDLDASFLGIFNHGALDDPVVTQTVC